MPIVYILRSIRPPQQSYTGSTDDLERRLQQHNDGLNKSTRAHRPWRIEAYVECDTRQTAEIVEAYFKNNSGQEKFRNFARGNPIHPNPKQGFFDTLEEGRAFGSNARRFRATKENGRTVFVMNG
tara:strand:+ start:175 stop:549 length:375 start_codon:yes stop_codon:yes gene_type:complete